MDFENFDESIGVAGYYDFIRKKFFPNSSEFSFDIANFQAEERYYPKGTYFSRVRKLTHEKAYDFFCGNINIDDFYPPRAHIIDIPEGRFNRAKKSTFYLADHPFVAMKECDIHVGDFFLMSYFSLPRNMCFMHLEDGKDDLSKLLFNLFKSRDKKFYPVINLIYSDFINFDKHDGIAYDSIKVNYDHVEINSWGPISSVVNFAIQNQKIRDFKLEVSWLMYCNEDFKPVEYSIYMPLSGKKRNRISKLNYRGNKKEYIKKTTEICARLQADSRKGEILLGKGKLKASNEIPFKIVDKLPRK
ncbi:RES domain-containing protein [Pantoea sp. ARC270]|uniref:RES domain-containing protein n=1 Tax=Pantoea sp. ARC270 TaxID=2027923 RepID=UPI001314B4B9|nr:RES domain-containing protein [Pantoea sp. ARC270]